MSIDYGHPVGLQQRTQRYCSTNKDDALASTGEGTLRGEIGNYTWYAYPLSSSTSAVVSINLPLTVRGVGIDRDTYTIYCLLHPPGMAATDPSIKVTGLIINADLATIPQPVISVSTNELNLGKCRVGEVLTAALPLTLQYYGYGSTNIAGLDFKLSKGTSNPDDSYPAVTVGGTTIGSSTWQIPLQKGPWDPDVSLSFPCRTLGNFQWNLEITYSID